MSRNCPTCKNHVFCFKLVDLVGPWFGVSKLSACFHNPLFSLFLQFFCKSNFLSFFVVVVAIVVNILFEFAGTKQESYIAHLRATENQSKSEEVSTTSLLSRDQLHHFRTAANLPVFFFLFAYLCAVGPFFCLSDSIIPKTRGKLPSHVVSPPGTEISIGTCVCALLILGLGILLLGCRRFASYRELWSIFRGSET